jgi:hypothetical protein
VAQVVLPQEVTMPLLVVRACLLDAVLVLVWRVSGRRLRVWEPGGAAVDGADEVVAGQVAGWRGGFGAADEAAGVAAVVVRVLLAAAVGALGLVRAG